MPGDLPALGPKSRLPTPGTADKDLHDEPLAGEKELQGDAKAEGGLEVRPHGQRVVAAGEGADTVTERGFARRSLTYDANGNADKNEAGVGQGLTQL